MRRQARTDSNQKKIVEQLRRCGFSVAITSQLGCGFPDIVVGAKCKNFLFEIKDPEKPKSQRILTHDEALFQTLWCGQYNVIETIDDALKIIDNKN